MSSHGLAQHAAARLAAQMERRAKREKMTWGRRLDLVFLVVERQSQMAGRMLDGGRVSSGKSRGNAPQGGVDLDIDREVNQIVGGIRALEGMVDRYSQRPVSADYVNEHEEDRDKRLVEDFEGLTPEEVWRVDPSFAPTGDFRAIERARVRMGRDPYLGGGTSDK